LLFGCAPVSVHPVLAEPAAGCDVSVGTALDGTTLVGLGRVEAGSGVIVTVG